MRFGCLYFANSENIGDDIQTYAQWRFLPKVDYWIDRESLNTFYPEEGENVALIMNAWFMYSPENWPPSPYIIPLFVSSHFSRYHMKWLEKEDEKYSFGQQYLKENSPIGCRDGSTLTLLQSLGIEAYFSGCLTLTIPPFTEVGKEDYICLVDVPEEVVIYIQEKGYSVRVMTHTNKNLNKMQPEERLVQVEKYLKIYQGARCVVTSRLHCALPCTGLRTPVLVISESNLDGRFDTLKNFIYIADKMSLLEGKWDDFLCMPACCESEYGFYRNNLRKVCQEFIGKLINTQTQIRVDIPYEWYKDSISFQESVRKEIYNAEIHQLNDRYENVQKMNHELKQWVEDFQNERKIYMDEINRYLGEVNTMEKAINDLQKMNVELTDENKELRDYSGRQEKAIKNLQEMNTELRTWSEDLAKENQELKSRIEAD